MNEPNDIFASVKESVSILDAAHYYGLEVNKGGFVSCPFHAERTPSMKLYDETDTYYCFGCGEHGDVIALVSGLFTLSPYEAACKLSRDFGVAADLGEPRKSREKPSIKAKIKRYSYELEENRTYRLLADYCDYLKRCREDFAPKSPDERPNPLFMKSLCELERYRSYVEVFISGSKDERLAFMRDYGRVLAGIERELKGGRDARQAEELA